MPRILHWRTGLAWYLFVFVGFLAIEAIGILAVLGPGTRTSPFEGWQEIVAAARAGSATGDSPCPVCP